MENRLKQLKCEELSLQQMQWITGGDRGDGKLDNWFGNLWGKFASIF